MHTLLRLVQSFDLQVYYFLSRFHGSWILDRLASHMESNNLLKSGVLISLYWYFWFRDDPQRQERRSQILSILTGTLAGLVVTRGIASLATFRVRPLYDAALQHQPLSILPPTNFMNWSSFPSDHAAYLCGLGFGVICLRRRLTIPVVLFLAGWVCLPRLYLGIHFVSDIVVGAALGILAVWSALRSEWLKRTEFPLLRFAEASPGVFYAVAFVVLFEMAALFADVREPVRAALNAASRLPHFRIIEALLILVLTLLFAGLTLRRRASPIERSLPEQEPLRARAARSGRQ